MLHLAAMGVVLGLSAGLAPGPLTALVISETLRGGVFCGMRVALAPLITDLPIIVFCLLVLTRVAQSDTLLALISFCGALFVARMAWENITLGQVDLEVGEVAGNSLGRGIVTNLLSPHPYLFWLTVGAPIMGQAMRSGYAQVAAFLLGFYLLLVGTKLVLAVLVARSRNILTGRRHLLVLRLLGGVLLLFALLLVREGVGLLAA